VVRRYAGVPSGAAGGSDRADHSQQGGAADRCRHLLDQPGAGASTQRHRHLPDRLLCRCGATSVPHRQPCNLLSNVFLAHPGWPQKNRRTCSATSTCRPPMAESTSRRRYRLCTRAAVTPQPGHEALLLVALASIRTRPALSEIRSSRKLSEVRQQRRRVFHCGHKKRSTVHDHGTCASLGYSAVISEYRP
jgi:hypothetical protein